MLRKISEMLEVILRRMDALSRLSNSSSGDAHRLEELSSALDRCAHAHTHAHAHMHTKETHAGK